MSTMYNAASSEPTNGREDSFGTGDLDLVDIRPLGFGGEGGGRPVL